MLIRGGEGGIRTHGADNRTTVFEFYDSHADPCRPVAKRVLWFANLASTILPCIARYRSVPRSWFAIWFAIRGLKPLRKKGADARSEK